jgi:hypothetical protein
MTQDTTSQNNRKIKRQIEEIDDCLHDTRVCFEEVAYMLRAAREESRQVTLEEFESISNRLLDMEDLMTEASERGERITGLMQES